ncbi:MAG: hypothetical protein HDR01_10885 [Lachnospiraceae bacterium]|nr:hypothetical protein [Lachnospiraceae bacterium]
MNRVVNLEKMDFCYWIDELPNIKITNGSNRVIEILGTDESLNYTLQVALELSLHKHISSYALLGFDYVPAKNTNNLIVSIKYSDENEINYLSKIRSVASSKYIYRGLDEHLLPAVVDSIIDFGKENPLPAGYLKFDIAANCEIGSSSLIFGIITKMLLTSLLNIHKDRLMEDGYLETLFTNIIMYSEMFKK